MAAYFSQTTSLRKKIGKQQGNKKKLIKSGEMFVVSVSPQLRQNWLYAWQSRHQEQPIAIGPLHPLQQARPLEKLMPKRNASLGTNPFQ